MNAVGFKSRTTLVLRPSLQFNGWNKDAAMDAREGWLRAKTDSRRLKAAGLEPRSGGMRIGFAECVVATGGSACVGLHSLRGNQGNSNYNNADPEKG